MRRSSIERLLPPVYQRTAAPPGVLAALLEAMAALHEPSERLLTAVEDLFTPYRSPDQLVPFLLSWVAFEHVVGPPNGGAPVPLGRLRNLLAHAAELSQWRGTAPGLRAVVELLIGHPVEVHESADRPFHLVVRLPPVATDYLDLVRRVVAAEKPAATTCEVIVAPATLA